MRFWSIREIEFPGGTRTFRLGSDDGAILDVGDTRVISRWATQSYGTTDGSISLTAGWHTIRIQYFEDIGTARVSLAWW